jgi:NAD(P)-dependent dehydrogenase (short-subunit alcohol dehydrogenase family)
MSGYKIPDVKNVYYEKYIEEMPTMEGKRIAITGTTTGTGKAVSKAVMMKGGHVLALNRPSERVTSSSTALREAAPGGTVTDIPCDLQSFDSVAAAVSNIESACEGSGLDALVLNAGATT